MCGICGCSVEDGQMIDNEHHTTHHVHSAPHEHLVDIEQNILAQNNEFAAHNRDYFLGHKILALNLMSSPGSGKTTLLSKTISDLGKKIDIAVIVGDQQTDCDAQMLKSSGADAWQINTGKVCHLDAHMVSHAIQDLSLKKQSLLFIENVGNLVCPASFHLGEQFRIVILSVTEGENKPLKYPDMFHSADLLLITKADLLPHVNFDLDLCKEYVRRTNPSIDIITLSAVNGVGLNDWYNWLLNSFKFNVQVSS
ncbi:TPA: hydrogenase nickel incorporation protein HypB [Legionella pneumophila]|nr:hydrogenase nickel incorporation protein HypB [Legionella pneumophila]